MTRQLKWITVDFQFPVFIQPVSFSTATPNWVRSPTGMHSQAKSKARGPKRNSSVWGSDVRSQAWSGAKPQQKLSLMHFWGFKNQQFLSTTHYLTVSSTSNFNDLAFMLGLTGFGRLGSNRNRGPKPEQVQLSPLATIHFNHCIHVTHSRLLSRFYYTVFYYYY